MLLAAIESSGQVASVAILRDETLVAEYSIDYKKTHSTTLLPMLEEIVERTEIQLSDLDAIAVSSGPGSFTGLRIGSATAKGLGLALDIPLVEVPTLEALAYQFFGSPQLICPMMDARRGQVYTGLYRFSEKGELTTIFPQAAIQAEQIIEKINEMGESVVFLGDGVGVYRQLIEEKCKVSYLFAPPHMIKQRAGALAALAAVYLKEGKTISADLHKPEYLRLSQAERERMEREKGHD
ncbi:MAG: tRNA (adenosine(37)-N6)-threonylcarbamoyltransferase complex dimerization subunit type 1 TsaB [Lachnospiraceae bacterium]|nr:tRNA (adenosine(37)-N6)-threonylcarbamoyltransferase complex dimerization subunit type 1 TsaB [Lachnospiraceae bacterium]